MITIEIKTRRIPPKMKYNDNQLHFSINKCQASICLLIVSTHESFFYLLLGGSFLGKSSGAQKIFLFVFPEAATLSVWNK